jgi:hypothetical protein
MTRAPLLVAGGLLAQGLLLVPLAGVGGRAGWGVAAGAALAAALAAAAGRWLAPAGGASLAMLAAGGLGMTLGWWADLDFASAAAVLRDAPDAAAWCGFPARDGHGLPGAHLLSWMNAGMLAAGGLALRVAGARGACGGPAARFVGAAAMVAGMGAGAALAAPLGRALPAERAVVAAHALMNAGMLAGMQAAALAAIGWRALRLPRLPAPAPRSPEPL